MSTKVSITKEKLDDLANVIADKSGESVPMTINQMISAVEGISGGGHDKELIEGTISGVYENDATFIRSNCFVSTGLTSVTFSQCSIIGYTAFGSCSSLTNISFPACQSIGGTAFGYCVNLTSANFPEVTETGANAFLNCSALSQISFPKLTTMAGGTFQNCFSLESAVLPMCSSIGNTTFYNCYNLSYASFASTLSIISNSCFYNCSNLTSITATGIQLISGTGAFAQCGLVSVEWPTLTMMGRSSTSGANNVFESCASLTYVSFNNCSGAVGSYAFRYCTALQTLWMPKIGTIQASAFAGCSALKSIYFPSVTSYIQYAAFGYCPSMSVAVIGNASTARLSVFTYAFTGGSNLASVYFFGEYGFQFSSSVFTGCWRLKGLYLLGGFCGIANTTVFGSTPIAGFTAYTGGVYGSIYVPESRYEVYKSGTYWSTYSSRFVSLTQSQIDEILMEVCPPVPD